MKKIAICLRGAISKIGTNFYLYENLFTNNSYVNFISCFNSINKHIINTNKDYQFDFFIHSYNIWDATGTNGAHDVNIDDPKDLIDELNDIGFHNISYAIKPEWDANIEKYKSNNDKWIFVKAFK